MSMWLCKYCDKWFDFGDQHDCPVLELKAKVLDELVERGIDEWEGMETATQEMIEAGVVPRGWSIYDLRKVDS